MKSKFKFQVFPSLQDRKTNLFGFFLGEVKARQFLIQELLNFSLRLRPNYKDCMRIKKMAARGVKYDNFGVSEVMDF